MTLYKQYNKAVRRWKKIIQKIQTYFLVLCDLGAGSGVAGAELAWLTPPADAADLLTRSTATVFLDVRRP